MDLSDLIVNNHYRSVQKKQPRQGLGKTARENVKGRAENSPSGAIFTDYMRTRSPLGLVERIYRDVRLPHMRTTQPYPARGHRASGRPVTPCVMWAELRERMK
ncbi:hypothetical protein HNR39_000864 [Glaciimonas immobilis]|uniref:Uncharacterized protein n=1 Tax=Glaciimonas immobilis TaxID=728004 RepID=A0A840RQQ5_9BURK|nr:hypothetical protein [Glaciimonas immobilis]